MPFTANAQSLQPGAEIFLYRLDATLAGAGVHYFVQAAQANGNAITFGGQAYTPVDLSTEGFESNAGGVLPTPKLTIANTDGFIQALVNQYGDLAGCGLRRVRTFARFLDGGAEPDPNAYSGPDSYRIERKSNENPIFIEWELSASFDQEGKLLPGRQFLRDTCTRRYRRWAGVGQPSAAPDGYIYPTVHPCPYSASGAWTAAGVATTASGDRCGRKDSDCRLRFGEDGVLPTGAFPGIARV